MKVKSVKMEPKEENNDNKPEKHIFKWKGKFVSEKVYNKRLKQSEQAKKKPIKVPEEEKAKSSVPESPPSPPPFSSVIVGSRIVDFDTLIENLYCRGCKTDLLLKNIEEETGRGLASVLVIRCHSCLLLTEVPLSKMHTPPGYTKPRFDINTRYALGLVYAQLEHEAVDKLLEAMNMPGPSYEVFKEHAKPVGEAIMLVAAQTTAEIAEKQCKQAAQEEIKQSRRIKQQRKM